MSTWLPPLGAPALSRDEVHVWRLDLASASLDLSKLMFSDAERETAAAFRRDEDRRRFLLSRGVLKNLLARYAGVRPADLRFARDCRGCGSWNHGKPRLAAPPGAEDLRFNMSHSDGLVVYAVAREREVGVDVERIGAGFNPDAIVDRFFSQGERAALRPLAGRAKIDAFLAFWTCKEAYLKLRGYGLAVPLEELDMSQAALQAHARIAPWTREARDVVSFHRLDLGPDYAGSLATEEPLTVVKWWR